MNKQSYTSATIAELPTASSYHEQQRQNRLALIEAIENREGNPYGYDLEAMSTLQLEAILEYGSPHAFSTTEYTDDRNFITGTKGRVHKGCDPLPDDNFRDYHDGRVVKSILGYRSYKRHLMSSYNETPEEAKERKIRDLFALVDDKYRKIVDYILEHDLDKLVEISMDRYEQTIRRYLAGMLRIRASAVGHVLTIEEACEAVGLPDTAQYLKYAQELMDADLYEQQDILGSTDSIVEQTDNIIFDLVQHHDEIDHSLGASLRAEIPAALDHFREEIMRLRSDKVLTLVMVVARRATELSLIDLFTPLVSRPDYHLGRVKSARSAARRIIENGEIYLSLAFDGVAYTAPVPETVPGTVSETVSETVPESQPMETSMDQAVEHQATELPGDSSAEQQHSPRTGRKDRYFYQIKYLADTVYEYIVEATLPGLECAEQIRSYITDGIQPDLIIYYESEPVQLGIKDPPKLLGIWRITEIQRQAHFQPECHQMDLGMGGEITRSQLAFARLHDSTMISSCSRQELINLARSVRAEKYRLSKEDIILPEHLELIEEQTDIFEIDRQVRQIQESHPERYIIIHDLRPLLGPYITSLLDGSLREALDGYGKHLIQVASSIHKFELSDLLQQYKRRYSEDSRELARLSVEEQLRLHYQHLPRLQPEAAEIVKSWIHHPRIQVGATMSRALTRTREGVTYRSKYLAGDNPAEILALDHIITYLSETTLVFPVLVSPDPGKLKRIRKIGLDQVDYSPTIRRLL